MSNVYRKSSGPLILPDGTVYDARAIVEKSLRESRADRAKNLKDAEILLKQAQDWRQKALDGRVSGLDHEVRALYVRKAEQAETEARRLSGQEQQNQIDLARAAELESEAIRHDKKAGDMSLPLDVRRYYRDKAIECRNLAAIHRGEKPLGEPPADTVSRSISINLPR